MKKGLYASTVFFILSFTLLSHVAIAQVTIQPKPCSCNGYDNGSIKIFGLPDTTEVRLERIDDSGVERLNNYDRVREFGNLAPGTYRTMVKGQGGEIPYPNVNITEPPILDFSIEQPTIDDLPRSADETGRIKIKYNSNLRNIVVYYKLDRELEFKNIEGKPAMTISDLQVGQYQIYIKNRISGCTSARQPVRLNTLEMFEIIYKPVRKCEVLTKSIEFELSNVVDQVVTVTYKYLKQDQGQLQPYSTTISQVDNKKTLKFKFEPQGPGDYEITAIGNTPERNRRLQFSLNTDGCNLTVNKSTTIFPNYDNGYKGSFTLEIHNPPAGDYSYKVMKGTEVILINEKFHGSIVPVENVPPVSFPYFRTNQN